MGNVVEGSVNAVDQNAATQQIRQMGYTPVRIQPTLAAPQPETTVLAGNVPVAGAVGGRGGPVDLTQPVTAMPAGAAGYYTPPRATDLTQEVTEMPEASNSLLASLTEAPEESALAETTARMERIEPWQRGGPPLPQTPAQPTVEMAAGAGPTQALPSGANRSEPSRYRVELARGLERIPFGANSLRKATLGQRFKEVMIYPIVSGVVLKDLAPFYRQFATLINAGLTLQQSLSALADNTKNVRLKEFSYNAQRQAQAGGRLSDVMAAYPWIFPPMHLEMIRAAEQGGMLDDALRQIGDYVEHELEVRRLISRETLYPKIVLFVALMLMGKPGIFEESPAIVDLVVRGDTGLYLRETVGFGLACLLPIFALVALFRLSWFNIPGVRGGYDAFKIKLPVVGKIIRTFCVAKFARTYAALSRAGFPASAALQIAGDASGNVVIARAAHRAAREAERGALPSLALRATGEFPGIAMDMLQTGEMSGSLDDMMDKVADYVEAEGKLKSHQVALIFSACILLLVGLMVLNIAMKFYGGYGNTLSSVGGG